MKKAISLILALTLLCALCACGAEKPAEPAPTSALAPAPEDALDATDGESAKEIAVPEESAVNKSAAEETTPDASPSDPSQP